MLNSIVLTLTELPDVKSVSVTVNGKSELVNEKGEKLSKPVSRPSKVNTGSFKPKFLIYYRKEVSDQSCLFLYSAFGRAE